MDLAKGYCDQVVLCADGGEVARHARLWDDEQVCFEPLHYLALLETKPGALNHARPLAGWTLPECFALLRRRLEAERDGDGTREYIKVLRLLEKHPLPKLREAVEAALQVGAITRDAVAQFLYPREYWRATLFSLDGHPHPSTGKTHLATALGFAACSQGKRVRFTTTTGLVTQLLEQRETRTLQRLHKQLKRLDVLILDELGYVPFSKTGAELLFDVVSRAYERTSLIVTTNLPFEQWTEVMGSERLTGALLDRLTHRVPILEASGQSYQLSDAKYRLKRK